MIEGSMELGETKAVDAPDRAPVAWGSSAEDARSYGDLRRLAERVAGFLRAQKPDRAGEQPPAIEGGAPGDPLRAVDDRLPPPVLVLCDDRYYFAAALLGAWMTGCRVVLPPSRGADVVRELSRRSGVVLHDGAQPEVLASGTVVGSVSEFELGTQGAAHQASAAQAGESAPWNPLVLQDEQIIVSVHTSGTTGEPQAWHKRARQLFVEADTLRRSLGCSSADRVCATVAPQHIYGLLFGVLLPLRAGASFFRGTPLHGKSIAWAARDASWLVSVPAHLRVLVDTPRAEPSKVKKVVSSGAPLAADIALSIEKLWCSEVVDVLGSTETGGIAWRRSALTCEWTPLPGVEIGATDAGLLTVRSPHLEKENTPYVAADRVRLLPGGRFEYLGREDDVVKVAGKRVSLGHLESRARRLDGVRDVAALGVDVGGLRGVELWLAVEGEGLEPKRMRRELRQVLDPTLIPRRIRIVERLPRTEQGKLRRDALKLLFPETKWDDRTRSVVPSPVVFLEEPALVGVHAGRAVAVVPENSPRFAGHFPGRPTLPGVSQLVDVVRPVIDELWPMLEPWRGVSRVKFQRSVPPGAPIEIVVERRDTRVRFTLRSGGDVCSSGTVEGGPARS